MRRIQISFTDNDVVKASSSISGLFSRKVALVLAEAEIEEDKVITVNEEHFFCQADSSTRYGFTLFTRE